MLGVVSQAMTPTGVELHGLLASALPDFIGAYKGGRNESIMHGEVDGQWVDYDMSGAYGTCMRQLGHPDYARLRRLTWDDLIAGLENDSNFLITNYVVAYVDFVCPDGMKYPPFAVRVDETATVYSLKGRVRCTGPELDAALRSGVKITILHAWIIPWSRDYVENSNGVKEMVEINHPFKEVITWLQQERLKYPKRSAQERTCKDLSNNFYGALSQGLNSKSGYDARHNCMRVIEGGYLASPVLASYVTGFIRAFLFELMNNVAKLGGRIISCTTDGFLTDIVNLEEQLMDETKFSKDETKLLRRFRQSRSEVVKTDDACGLEVKTEVGSVYT